MTEASGTTPGVAEARNTTPIYTFGFSPWEPKGRGTQRPGILGSLAFGGSPAFGFSPWEPKGEGTQRPGNPKAKEPKGQGFWVPWPLGSLAFGFLPWEPKG